MIFENKNRNILIQAENIEIADNARLGENILINVKQDFKVGNRTYIGNRVQIGGRNVEIGDDVRIEPMPYRGLDIGAGKTNSPKSFLKIGDRCTIHDGFMDLAEPITLGNDVGISPQTFVYNHGYWMSVLEGYPHRLGPVEIGSGTIVGFRSTIFGPAKIAEYSVIGAESLVMKNLTRERFVYAGSPARQVREVQPLKMDERISKLDDIISEYKNDAEYKGQKFDIHVEYPIVKIDNFEINIENKTYKGLESLVTDDFRRFIFRYGLRFYTKRPLVNRGETWSSLSYKQ